LRRLTTRMLSQTVSTTIPHNQEKLSVPAEVSNDAYVPNYNESDYSDFLYLAPPLSSQFLPLEPNPSDKAAALSTKKAKTRPAETINTGTTPPPVTPADGESFEEKEYFESTFPSVGKKTSTPEEVSTSTAADRRERRPSFIEVTPVKVHHEHEKHQDAHTEKRHSHSSHDPKPMDWWPEPEKVAQHEWVEEGEEEEDIIEEDVWSDAFYE